MRIGGDHRWVTASCGRQVVQHIPHGGVVVHSDVIRCRRGESVQLNGRDLLACLEYCRPAPLAVAGRDEQSIHSAGQEQTNTVHLKSGVVGGIGEEQTETGGVQTCRDRLHQRREERIGDVGDDQPHRSSLSFAQRAANFVRGVTQSLGSISNFLRQVGPDLAGTGQRTRHRCGRDTGQSGDVVDGRTTGIVASHMTPSS